MAVDVVDAAGTLAYFEKLDDTQTGSAEVAVAKARSAALFSARPGVSRHAGWRRRRAAGPRLENAVPSEGGVPLVVDGKIVGAIGVSGGTSQQDGQCATAGAAALV